MKKLFKGKYAWITYTVLFLAVGGGLYYYFMVYKPKKDAEAAAAGGGSADEGTTDPDGISKPAGAQS